MTWMDSHCSDEAPSCNMSLLRKPVIYCIFNQASIHSFKFFSYSSYDELWLNSDFLVIWLIIILMVIWLMINVSIVCSDIFTPVSSSSLFLLSFHSLYLSPFFSFACGYSLHVIFLFLVTSSPSLPIPRLVIYFVIHSTPLSVTMTTPYISDSI